MSDGLSPETVYQLYREATLNARLIASKIRTETELLGYYSLISTGIKCLQYLQKIPTLTTAQYAQVSLDLVDLLLKETHSLDMAESVLASVKERLYNHLHEFAHLKMKSEFIALYEIPLQRDTQYHYKIASRNCDVLLTQLKDDPRLIPQIWTQVFQFVSMWLDLQLGRRGNGKVIKTKFNQLLETTKDNETWRAFVCLYYISHLLHQRLEIPKELLTVLQNMKLEHIGPKLYCWKLISSMMIKIYKDENISDLLNDFKSLLEQHKDTLSNTGRYSTIELSNDTQLNVRTPFIFQYKDVKNILLLFQSVSYLVNCHDKSANFSIKFLSKVEKTTNKLSQNIMDLEPLDTIDNQLDWYKKLLATCHYYQFWENKLLMGGTASISPQDNLEAALEKHRQTKDTTQLITAYNDTITCNNTLTENKLISLINIYSVKIASLSQGVNHQKNVESCNQILSQIKSLMQTMDLTNNKVWECTLVIIWIISHMEPFTSIPLPSSEDEKISYMNKLKQFYLSNSFINSDNKVVLKKSLFIQIFLNYLGARLVEQDLDKICLISEKCFKLSYHNIEQLGNISYIMGLWHLMNCTSAMKVRDVAITKSKLESILEKLC